MKKLGLIKGIIIGILISVVLFASFIGGAAADRLFGIGPLDRLGVNRANGSQQDRTVLNEESVVIEVAERTSPSVVTVSIETPRRRVMQFDPFGGGFRSSFEGGTPQDIGSGFVVSADGLIITNKHVVSTEGTYKVVTNDDKEYEVQEIHRDPGNDLAILKINANNLVPIDLGDSDQLKVGQFVVAIGTALGEFRQTVTTGVISGLGRGITAGSVYEGFIERLDDVIQTDAAINPGNSGGPLLNSLGQVIGVNVAVAQGAQNIGFAIPVSTLKNALDQFNKNGSFASKAFLGVATFIVSRQDALLNDLPQGAYVSEVVAGSAAEIAGIQIDDIITKVNNESVAEANDGLAGIIRNFKPGDTIQVEIWRNGDKKVLSVSLAASEE